MKALLFSIGFFCCLSIQAQVYIGKETDITFFSKSTIEDISAHNKNVKPVFNTATGDLIIKIPNTGFTFKSALMQEHFNENYMESDKYPNSIFDGKINETVDYTKDGKYTVTATGNLTIHGVTKQVTIQGTIEVRNNELTMHAEFKVNMTDYNIEIPGLYVNTQSDSDEVNITVNSTLSPYKK
jgi:hypothetical protein